MRTDPDVACYVRSSTEKQTVEHQHEDITNGLIRGISIQQRSTDTWTSLNQGVIQGANSSKS